jgi:hypothetical protein
MTERLSNYELERMWKEAVVALFEEALLTRCLSEGTDRRYYHYYNFMD